MKKVNNVIYSTDYKDYSQEVNIIIGNMSKGFAKDYTSVTNGILGDSILARLIANDFLRVIGDNIKINEQYTINVTGQVAYTLHISKYNNDVDNGVIYSLSTH